MICRLLVEPHAIKVSPCKPTRPLVASKPQRRIPPLCRRDGVIGAGRRARTGSPTNCPSGSCHARRDSLLLGSPHSFFCMMSRVILRLSPAAQTRTGLVEFPSPASPVGTRRSNGRRSRRQAPRSYELRAGKQTALSGLNSRRKNCDCWIRRHQSLAGIGAARRWRPRSRLQCGRALHPRGRRHVSVSWECSINSS